MVHAKALLVGMNYAPYCPVHMQLKNSIRDALHFQEFLQERGVPKESICLLRDDESKEACSKANIISAILTLAQDSWKENLSHAYFLFSGHGSQDRDRTKAEADGLNEGIGPSDFQEKGLIVDDILRYLFSSFNPNTKVFCVFDCDNSGSIMDLPHYYINYEEVTPSFVTSAQPMFHHKIYLLAACKDKGISGVIKGEEGEEGTLTSYLLKILRRQPKPSLLSLQATLGQQLAKMGHENRVFILSSSHALTTTHTMEF